MCISLMFYTHTQMIPARTISDENGVSPYLRIYTFHSSVIFLYIRSTYIFVFGMNKNMKIKGETYLENSEKKNIFSHIIPQIFLYVHRNTVHVQTYTCITLSLEILGHNGRGREEFIDMRSRRIIIIIH